MKAILGKKEETEFLEAEIAYEYNIISKGFKGNKILLLSSSGLSQTQKAELELILGYEIINELIEPEALQKALTKLYRAPKPSLSLQNPDDPLFLSSLLEDAILLNASDLHFEILEDRGRIRYRVDGKLLERYSLDLEIYPALLNKIKIRSGLDITQKRLPQDGRIVLKEKNFDMDIRVSTINSLYGEKAVLRLLKQDREDLSFQELGMDPSSEKTIQQALKNPQGLILISGPTGSGKTTTLYTSLKKINEPKLNIMTIEDPVEYTLDGITQVQVNEKLGLTFSSVLKSFLRQDPDVMMVGEIRDQDTAQMAIRASLTGHLVLSTLHTNSAWGSVERLLDLGIPSYLLASTLNLLVSQRLVRLLCTDCKKLQEEEENRINIGFQSYKPEGCAHCFFTGFKGRIALYEMIFLNEKLREEIRRSGKGLVKGSTKMQENGLAQQALKMLKSGLTSLDEALPLLSETSDYV
jgi:type IV pilus assembly protein PilB